MFTFLIQFFIKILNYFINKNHKFIYINFYNHLYHNFQNQSYSYYKEKILKLSQSNITIYKIENQTEAGKHYKIKMSYLKKNQKVVLHK